MKMYRFAYHSLFDRAALRLMDELHANPRAGDVIPATNGARKMRIAVQGRGKSGGARAVYVVIEVADTFQMLLCYPKNMQGNLTPDQKRALRAMIAAIKREAR